MEVEAKLAADRPTTLSAIARRRRLGPYELCAVAAWELETVYLDTRGKDLLRRGAALRLRQTPAGVELTLKLPGTVASGVHRRPESTWRMRRMPLLPLRLRSRRLRGPWSRWTKDRDLVPLFGTRFQRRAVLVRRRYPLRPSRLSKLERALRWAGIAAPRSRRRR
jgi:inorganic triphosphatase YgiF